MGMAEICKIGMTDEEFLSSFCFNFLFPASKVKLTRKPAIASQVIYVAAQLIKKIYRVV